MRAALFLGVLCAHCAFGDVVSNAPEQVRVTLYRSPREDGVPFEYESNGDLTTGLAFVAETRTIDLPHGVSRLVFRGVADAIVPQTASVIGLPATIAESNFDYDLLSPGALVAKSHGERVRLVRTDAATGRTTERAAIVRTGPEGVMLEVDGQLEALDCNGLDEKIVYERVPPGLATEPTLSMTVRAARAGRHRIELSYLALGLDWTADYVAMLHPDEGTLALTGWLTLVNRGSTTFAAAPTDVVAGQVARDETETRPPESEPLQLYPACWPIGRFESPVLQHLRESFGLAMADVSSRAVAAPAEMVTVTGIHELDAKLSNLGDYKLYSLPAPTTLAARQSKQIRFLALDNVRYERLYRFEMDDGWMRGPAAPSWQRPAVLIRAQNREADGLGKPLPAGSLSVMEQHGDAIVLAGQDDLQDTPVDLPFELQIATAMDVWIEPRIIEDRTEQVSAGHRERQVQLEVRMLNDKTVPIVLEIRQPVVDRRDLRVLEESHPHSREDGDVQWTFKLAPGERAALRYSLRHTQ